LLILYKDLEHQTLGADRKARPDLALKGYGLANKEDLAANTENTVFRIGSRTKQFTAVAILQLQEHFFHPLGMHATYYDHNKAIIFHRASGYEINTSEILTSRLSLVVYLYREGDPRLK
jgi:CubicO group peptidase (beta-lactamase class C family)